MSPFDRAHMTSYWRSIVTIWLYLVSFLRYSMSKNEKCRDLEIEVRGHSRSLKVVPFGRSLWFPISVLYSNFVSKMHRFFKIFIFRTSLHSADSKCQISHRWSQNGSECTSLCAPKVIQEVNFPKSFLSSCIQDGL